MLSDRLADSAVIQPLLAATVVSMVLSPLLIRHNGRLAELVFPRTTPAPIADQEQLAGQRDHVIVCGFGRVGQNLARVLERQGFVYVALDSDPRAVELARRAGDPVIFGDGTATEMLEAVGLERCRVLVLTFAEATASMKIVKAVRELRPDLPILVRTQDDTKLEELQQAGATEIVPETLEASLMLVSHVLLLLDVPVSRVVKTVGDIRKEQVQILDGPAGIFPGALLHLVLPVGVDAPAFDVAAAPPLLVGECRGGQGIAEQVFEPLEAERDLFLALGQAGQEGAQRVVLGRHGTAHCGRKRGLCKVHKTLSEISVTSPGASGRVKNAQSVAAGTVSSRRTGAPSWRAARGDNSPRAALRPAGGLSQLT